jgi:hypothetical protein
MEEKYFGDNAEQEKDSDFLHVLKKFETHSSNLNLCLQDYLMCIQNTEEQTDDGERASSLEARKKKLDIIQKESEGFADMMKTIDFSKPINSSDANTIISKINENNESISKAYSEINKFINQTN